MLSLQKPAPLAHWGHAGMGEVMQAWERLGVVSTQMTCHPCYYPACCCFTGRTTVGGTKSEKLLAVLQHFGMVAGMRECSPHHVGYVSSGSRSTHCSILKVWGGAPEPWLASAVNVSMGACAAAVQHICR